MSVGGDGVVLPPRPQFYGRRHGRPLRLGRRTVLADRLPELAVTLPADGQPLHPRLLFAAPVAEVWLEIGFGAGEHLVSRALLRPDVGFIGCEPYINGVAALLARIRELRLQHIRVLADDARPLLDRLQDASIDRIFVLFADPWPKRRHHRRRFMQKETLAHMARVLRPGGELLFATDDLDYARWTLALATDHPAFAWCARRARDWREQPPGWVATRYEVKALVHGARCVYLRFRRRPAT